MTNVTFKYRCGDKVKDRVTGFTGIIEVRMECLNGCLRYRVVSPADKKTGTIQCYDMDEGQLQLMTGGLNKNPVKKSKTGAPMVKVER